MSETRMRTRQKMDDPAALPARPKPAVKKWADRLAELTPQQQRGHARALEARDARRASAVDAELGSQIEDELEDLEAVDAELGELDAKPTKKKASKKAASAKTKK